MNSLKVFLLIFLSIQSIYAADLTANLFSRCQWRWGTDFAGTNKNYAAYDYITMWLGVIDGRCPKVNSQNKSCTDFNPYWQGKFLEICRDQKKIPVYYGYVIVFEARNLKGYSDCDVHTSFPTVCQQGANFIRNNRNWTVSRYEMHAKKTAEYLGSDATVVFLLEIDYYQYFRNSPYDEWRQRNGSLSGEYLRNLYNDYIRVIKKSLPNALISWDISPWLSEKEMTEYWGHFKSLNIDYIHMANGRAQANSSEIKPNQLKWSFMKNLTGKNMLADSGYGVAGNQLSNNGAWYVNKNVNERILDGVIAAATANPDRNPSYRPILCSLNSSLVIGF